MNRTVVHHHSYIHRPFYRSDLYRTYLRPAIYFTLAILVLLFSTLLHGSFLIAGSGALGIIILTASKILKSRSGIFFSVLAILSMIMLYLWNWVDVYFLAILSAKVLSNKPLFMVGLTEGATTLIVLWVYIKLLHNFSMRITNAWFEKQSFLKFIELLFFFQLFLCLFWLTGYLVDLTKTGSNYSERDFTIIAGSIALLAAGIPSIIYLVRSQRRTHKHQHKHHHRHRKGSLPEIPKQVKKLLV